MSPEILEIFENADPEEKDFFRNQLLKPEPRFPRPEPKFNMTFWFPEETGLASLSINNCPIPRVGDLIGVRSFSRQYEDGTMNPEYDFSLMRHKDRWRVKEVTFYIEAQDSLKLRLLGYKHTFKAEIHLVNDFTFWKKMRFLFQRHVRYPVQRWFKKMFKKD